MACKLCGGEVGPDITGRPMCYACGPDDVIPEGALKCPVEEGDAGVACDSPLGRQGYCTLHGWQREAARQKMRSR